MNTFIRYFYFPHLKDKESQNLKWKKIVFNVKHGTQEIIIRRKSRKTRRRRRWKRRRWMRRRRYGWGGGEGGEKITQHTFT